MPISHIQQRLEHFLKLRLSCDEDSINHRMNMSLMDWNLEMVVLKFPVEQWQLNPMGGMHGGMIATAIDITMGCAAYTFSDAQNTPTINLNIQYIRPVLAIKPLYVKAVIDHVGGRIMQVHGIGWQDKEQIPCVSVIASFIVNHEG